MALRLFSVTCLLLLGYCVKYLEAAVTLRMQNASLTVDEGSMVDVCVVASFEAGSMEQIEATFTTDIPASSDFTLPSSALSFDVTDGMMQTKCWTVAADQDSIFEDTEIITMSLSTTTVGALVDGTVVATTVSILDDESVTVNMKMARVDVVESEMSSATVCAVLSSGLTRERNVVVQLSTTTLSPGFREAVPGEDYESVSMTKTFTPVDMSQCIDITIVNDHIFEYFEIINVTLMVDQNSDRVVLGSQPVTDVYIRDDESVDISMRNNAIVGDESGGDIEVCAQLDGPTGGIERNVTVHLTSTDHGLTDLVFPSSSEVGTTRCKTITVVEDHIFQENPIISDTYTLADDQGRVMASGTTTVTVNDNDDVTISLQQSSDLTVNESDGPIRVCAVLNGPSGGLQTTVSIQFDITGQNSMTKVFSSSSAMGATQCTDIVIDNDVYEIIPRQLTVSLSSTQTRVTASGSRTFTINDDDAVSVSMQRPSILQAEAVGNVNVLAVLSGPAGGLGTPVTVVFTSSISQSSVSRMFPSGSRPGAMVTFQRNIVNDQVFQAAPVLSEIITLSSTQSRVTVTQQDTTTVTVTDDDDVVVGLTNSSQIITQSEGDADVIMCAVINSPAGGLAIGQTVTVEFSVTGHVQETVTRTFPSGSPRGSTECTTVTIADENEIFESSPRETYTVTLGSTQSRVTASGTTTIIVNDDNDVTITLQQPSSLTVDESDRSISVCAVLNGPSGGLQTTVSIQFVVAGQKTVTTSFPSPSAMGATQCTDVEIDNDVYEMSPRQLTVSLSSTQTRVTTSGSLTFNINDDDDVSVSMQRPSILQTEASGNVNVSAVLNGPAGGLGTPVTVEFTSTNGQTPVSRVFPSDSRPGAMVYLQRNIVNDQVFQTSPVLSETITLSSSQSRVTVTQQDTTTVTVTDDDDVVVGLTNSSQIITRSEGDADVTVCAVINSPVGGLAIGQTVTVEFSITGHVQMTVTRTFPSGSPLGSTQCTTVSIADENGVFESSPRETYIVTLGSTQSRVTASGTTTIIVNDDDDPVIALQQTPYTFSESTPEEIASICVVLEGPTGGLAVPFGVTLSIVSGTANAGDDFFTSLYEVEMMFTTSDVMGSTKCVTIRIVDDDLGEADEVFTVNVRVTSQTSRVSISGDTTTTITIVDNEVFPKPLNLTTSDVNSTYFQLSWDRPDTTSINVALTSYTVVCNSQTIATIPASTTNRVIYNLMPYTTHTCTVAANLEGNNIGQSTPITVTTLQEAPGSPPLGITKTLSTSSSITLSWSPPLESYGIIIHYTLYIDYINGTTFNTTSTENMYTISSLNPYQTVSVRVSASTSVGKGPQSTPAAFTTDEETSGPVGNLTVNKVDDNSFTVIWTRPVNLYGVLLMYYINVSNSNNPQGSTFTVTEESFTVMNLAPYVPYKISVAAVNGAGVGEYLEIIAFTAEGVPVAHPQSVITERINGTSVLVTWTHLSLYEARGFITNYNITYWAVESDMFDVDSILVPGEENSTIISGLDPGSQYYFTVSASTVEGQSNFSEPILLPLHVTFDLGGAVGGTVVTVVIVLIISIYFGLLLLYKKHRKSKEGEHQQNSDDTTREYEEIQLHSQHPQVVPTQKCEAYGFLDNSTLPPPITTSVATEDHVYERVS